MEGSPFCPNPTGRWGLDGTATREERVTKVERKGPSVSGPCLLFDLRVLLSLTPSYSHHRRPSRASESWQVV